MPRSALTGTRIRERRALAGVRQAELARSVGISPAYLNLIEHNRRRAGAGLVAAIAAALGVPPRMLDEGAESALFEGLREAAAGAAATAARPETDRVEEFASRFPGWAALLADRQDRLAALGRTVEALTDRISHDPHLSAAVLEVVSAITSVRSTAAILAETEDIEPHWRMRFHRNIAADSERLTEAAAALVAYLDSLQDLGPAVTTPQEEAEAWLSARNFHLPELEGPGAVPGAAVAGAPELATQGGRALALAHAERYAADAAALPLAALGAALAEAGPDPAALAARFGVGLAPVMRRLAALPGDAGVEAGLVICDGAGAITFRRPLAGFALPRFGAGCPLWPLFDALRRPAEPVRARVEMAGLVPRRFTAYAVAEARGPVTFDAPPVIEATMLVLPDAGPRTGGERPVGPACRTCTRTPCPARREPSIMAEGA